MNNNFDYSQLKNEDLNEKSISKLYSLMPNKLKYNFLEKDKLKNLTKKNSDIFKSTNNYKNNKSNLIKYPTNKACKLNLHKINN